MWRSRAGEEDGEGRRRILCDRDSGTGEQKVVASSESAAFL
jgi:hypothetical protein